VQQVSRGLALFGILLLAGCGTIGQSPGTGPAPIEGPGSTEVTEPETAVQPVPPEAPPEPVTSAVRNLMDRAESATGNGDFEQAIALLERAQRIDADSGEIYLALAKTYMAKGDVGMASAAAERGMLYCRGSLQCGALRGYVE
jgi:tetratricopeptide (TPR) repeat protein